MSTLPHELYTAEQTRELERIVTEQHNISSAKLMSRAGRAALDCIKCHWPQAERILVVCGTGNNGGDGFELARQAIAEEYLRSGFHRLDHCQRNPRPTLWPLQFSVCLQSR